MNCRIHFKSETELGDMAAYHAEHANLAIAEALPTAIMVYASITSVVCVSQSPTRFNRLMRVAT